MAAGPVFISANEVENLVSMRDIINVLDKAMMAASTKGGGVVQPVRSRVPVEKHGG